MLPNAYEQKLKNGAATNFSKKPEADLDQALMLTRGRNDRLFIFHCLEEHKKDFRELDRLNVENTDRMKDAVIKSIERLAARGITVNIEQVDRRSSAGKLGEELVEIATGVRADMIVMGTPSSDKL